MKVDKTKYMRRAKSILVLMLSFSMLISPLQNTVYAGESVSDDNQTVTENSGGSESGEDNSGLLNIPMLGSSQTDTDSSVIKLNGNSTKLDSSAFSGSVTEAAFGDSMSLTIDGRNDAEFRWLPDKADLENDAWKSGIPSEPGNYYLGYILTDDGTSDYKGNFGFRITKATLASPVSLSWNGGSTAKWSPVTKTTTNNEGTLDSTAVSGYNVKLYKDGVLKATRDVAGSQVTSCDFSSEMLASEGVYSFTVQAVSGVTDHYNNSEVSIKSGSAYAVKVSVSGDSGISAVTPETAAILIAGNSSHNSLNVSATVKSGRNFKYWSTAEGINCTGSSTSATASVADSYSGSTSVTLTAATKDIQPPAVQSYTAGTGSQYGHLLAQAEDSETGIAAYAFSTATDSSGVIQNEWTDVSPAVSSKTIDLDIADKSLSSGQYYFYAKDADENTVRSSSPIDITKVTYHNYYLNSNTPSEYVQYLAGTQGLTLAVPSRPGYSFGGWYSNASFSGSAVSTLSVYSSSGTDVYGRWTREKVQFSTQPQNVSKTYDGTESILTAVLSNTAGTAAYQWYKNGSAISGADGTSYIVKNVSDSGRYSVSASVTVDGETLTESSNTAEVNITKASLNIKANDISITYGDAAPEYTVSFSGFKGSDTSESAFKGTGTVSCDYGSSGKMHYGTYSIIPERYTAADYDITYTAGILTVGAKDVKNDSSVIVTLSYDTAVYTGAEIKPEVTVTDGGKTVNGSDYTVSYSNDVNVGEATASVTFRDNYTGTRNLTYEITKAAFSAKVLLPDWTYGESAPLPTLDTNPGSGTVTYYYGTSGNNASATEPSDAGNYYVYAVIAETGNYSVVTTEKTAFTIRKRSIVFASASENWVYDGNSHSTSVYTQKGEFVGSDGFQSITVTGQIKDVGKAENTISCNLSSSTDTDNYDIRCVPGILSVTAQKLTVPSNFEYYGGYASWTAVTKTGLEVKYELKLYRDDQAGQVGGAVYTKDRYYDFSKIMQQDSISRNSCGGYYCTVRTIPTGGSASENFLESDESAHSDNNFTASVRIAEDQGISETSFAGEQVTSSDNKIIITEGRNYYCSASAKKGYSLADRSWTADNSLMYFYESTNIDGTKNKYAYLSSSVTAALDIIIYVHSTDNKPIIGGFSASADSAGKNVTFNLSASDTIGLKGWAVTSSETAPSEWNSITGSEISVSSTVSASGTYYGWVKDTGGNTVSSDAITLYKIDFKGNFSGMTGTSGIMDSIIKVQNTSVQLPDNKYRVTGYTFKNWLGASGIYANGGAFAANTDDTLYAQWTNEKYTFRTEYYLMDTDGKYPVSSNLTNTFSAAFGAEISVSSASIQISRTGMSLDLSHHDTIKIDGSGRVLHVYYKRDTYKIAYSYTLPDSTEKTVSYDTYYYGQPVTAQAKPEVNGYTFVGWIFGESGTAPDTMPNKDISATGTFSARSATYTVNYYEQNVSGNYYTLMDDLTETLRSTHGTQISADIADAKEIEGFSAAGVSTTKGAVGGCTAGSMTASADGVVSLVSGDKLNINYYYTRNRYGITLNVWKGDRTESGNKLYTHSWNDIPYGQTITADDYTKNTGSWTINPDDIAGYELADYTDWSTGSEPEIMPAGNISVARDYVESTSAAYNVEVYLEGTVSGQFSQPVTFTYYAPVGKKVTIGATSANTIDYTAFRNSINNFTFYSYDSQNSNTVSAGYVKDSNNNPSNRLVLKVYFIRPEVETTITYYYNDGNSTSQKPFATYRKKGKWGAAYDIELTKLFDGTCSSDDVTFMAGVSISGTAASKYNFRNNKYVIGYSGYYYDGSSHWPGNRLVDDLQKTYTSTFGRTGTVNTATSVIGGTSSAEVKNYMNIYYSYTDQSKSHYYLNLAYKDKTGNNHPLTAAVNGVSYDAVRVCNKSDIFNVSFSGTVSADYPGLALVKGTYTYGSMKTGFTEVSYNNGKSGTTYTCYAAEESGNKILYITDDTNQLFYGNFMGYSLPVDAPGYSSVDDYLAENNDINVYSRSYGSAFVYSGNPTLVVTFYYKTKYTVTYNLNGAYCTNHNYVAGSRVDTIGCSDGVFTEKPGYSIVWYKESTFNNKAVPFNINDNVTLYGRYEKNILSCSEYVYYELPDAIKVNGSDTTYITADNMAQVSADHPGMLTSSEDDSKTVTFENDVKLTSAVKVPVTNYYYEGKLVMTDSVYPCLTYSPITMDYSTAVKSGFHYDDTNTGNTLHVYCQSAALDMAAYFARDTYSVSVSLNNTKNSNQTTSIYRYGQTVSINAPEKNGYVFGNWIWRKSAASDNSVWTAWTGETPTAASDGSVSFTMPAFNISMTSSWTAAKFDKKIIHYFQEATQTYDTDQLAVLQKMSGNQAAITFGSWSDPSGRIYYQGNTLLGASMKHDDYTIYFSGASVSGNTAAVEAADLLAATQSVSLLSEASANVAAYILSDNTAYSMFSYAFTRYQ